MSLPTLTFRRATLCARNPNPSIPYHIQPLQHQHQQTRSVSLLKRPHRPYTFTQLITLSDGSTYTTRTTSPSPIYVSIKDSRNHIMWNPSLSSLRNVEDDEAGRLKAFRNKFGRGWDVDGGEGEGDGEGGNGEKVDFMMDLISEGYAKEGRKELVGRVEAGKGGKGGAKKGKK